MLIFPAKTVGVRLNVAGAEYEEADDEDDDILAPRRKRQNRRYAIAFVTRIERIW